MLATIVLMSVVATDPQELAVRYCAYRDDYVVAKTKSLTDEQRTLRGVRTREAAERKKAIGEQLRTLKQKPKTVVPRLPVVLSVGLFGVFDPGDLVIRQILGPKEMVVAVGKQDLAIIRGLDTSNRAVDRGIVDVIPFGVTGKEERKNLLGVQRTAFILEPIDLGKVKALDDADQEKN